MSANQVTLLEGIRAILSDEGVVLIELEFNTGEYMKDSLQDPTRNCTYTFNLFAYMHKQQYVTSCQAGAFAS